MIIIKNLPELSDRLKYIRKVMGMSQFELAKIALTTQQAVQQAESGKARNPRYLHRLAITLNIPYEWLTMNLMPDDVRPTMPRGFTEKSNDVLDNFFAMPKKDQELLLELMKTRRDKK